MYLIGPGSIIKDAIGSTIKQKSQFKPMWTKVASCTYLLQNVWCFNFRAFHVICLVLTSFANRNDVSNPFPFLFLQQFCKASKRNFQQKFLGTTL